MAALLPAASLVARAPVAHAQSRFTGKRIDLELQAADLRQVLQLFAEIGHVNIIAEREVEGRVTARLRGVPWDEALHRIVTSQGYVLERERNVYYVRRPSSARRSR